jgi:hypothetical protein
MGRHGRVLSASDIITSGQRPTMMQVVERPWECNYQQQRSFAIQPLLDPPTSHVMTYWGEAGRRTMFPVAFGNDAVISIPVQIDLRSERTFTLGQCTGKWLDTRLKCIDDPRKGYFFIGGTCPTILHCIRIKAEALEWMTVRYVATPESSGGLGVFPLAGCLLLGSETHALTTTFRFFLNSSEPSFLLMAHANYWIDMAQYTLEIEDQSLGRRDSVPDPELLARADEVIE